MKQNEKETLTSWLGSGNLERRARKIVAVAGSLIGFKGGNVVIRDLLQQGIVFTRYFDE